MLGSLEKIGITNRHMALFAIVATVTTAIAAPLSAFAAITQVDVSCTNNGGQQPAGQQPTCTGGGLTQQTQNQNPTGFAPPGQNK